MAHEGKRHGFAASGNSKIYNNSVSKVVKSNYANLLNQEKANHWSNTSGQGSVTSSMNHADAIRMNKLNDERKKLGFNKNGIKTFEPLTLASLDSDNRPMMLSPITDAKRIDNSTSKVINNHFHYNRSIPFGQGEEIQQNGPWVYSV